MALTNEERAELDYTCQCGDSGHDHLATPIWNAPYRVGKCRNCLHCEQYRLGDEGERL